MAKSGLHCSPFACQRHESECLAPLVWKFSKPTVSPQTYSVVCSDVMLSAQGLQQMCITRKRCDLFTMSWCTKNRLWLHNAWSLVPLVSIMQQGTVSLRGYNHNIVSKTNSLISMSCHTMLIYQSQVYTLFQFWRGKTLTQTTSIEKKSRAIIRDLIRQPGGKKLA